MDIAELKESFHRRTTCRVASAFTLVELLVVIGIIALLISILLPSLAAARQAAQRTACAAKLHALMLAANIHAADHKGYYPLVGQIAGNITNGSAQSNPAGLDDAYGVRYTYLSNPGLTANNGDYRQLAPINLALGAQMGFGYILNNINIDPSLTSNGLSRNFLCPSQAASTSELAQQQQVGWLYAGYFGNYYGGWISRISYVFNEAVLGFDDSTAHDGTVGYGRLKGNSAAVRQPAKTMFVCDGLGGSTKSRLSGTWTAFNMDASTPPQPWPSYTMWNNQSYPPVTMSDAITHRTNPTTGKIIAGDALNFDQVRHRGKMNIAFCDGHVELRDIPPFTLASNGLIPTFKSDPNASALMNVYLLAP